MAGRIPQQFIDELMTRTDIVAVIDARVPLKKAGREYAACCPFHSEKTPSFTVSPSKQFYHCFGCGAHGTAISFLMEYDHLDFVESIEELARMAGLAVPRAEGPERGRQEGHTDLYEVLAHTAAFYQQQLREHPQRSRAVEYLRHRGLSGEVAAQYGIGFAPPGQDHLLRTLGTHAATRKSLITLGLAIERPGGGAYDRFRDRIQFPIRDRRGRVVGFGGRVLGDEKPKYLNSPESVVFHKGSELYGLHEARKSGTRPSYLLVVEGYMDVMALAQFGIPHAVATLGTSTTREHLDRLYRLVNDVVFCFDGDRAGRAAAWRALENILPVLHDGRQARFLFLPEGEDPDSMVRTEGRETFENRIAESVPFSDFFYAGLIRRVDTSSIDGRARLVELARPLLKQLPQGVFRHLMIERLAEMTQTDANALRRLVAGDRSPPTVKPAGIRVVNSGSSPVRKAISLLLHKPELAQRVACPAELRLLDIPGANLLRTLLELMRDSPHLNTGAVLERWRDTEEGQHLRKLARWAPETEELDTEAELRGILEQLRHQQIERRTERLLQEARLRRLSDAEKIELKELLDANVPTKEAQSH
jgi:DNA primase